MRERTRAATHPQRAESHDLTRPKPLTLAARRAPHPHAVEGGKSSADPAPPTGFAHDFSRIPARGATTTDGPGREGAPSSEVGSALDGGLRASLEGYFKTSLGGVRVHADPSSQATAERLGASAYTLGQDIHLGPEGVRAGGAARAALLAHEVVHTLQQGPTVARTKPKVGARDDAFERQADRLAAGFSRFSRNPHDQLALKIRDSMSIRQVNGAEPAIQRGRFPTHYGEFEDFQYQDLTDAAGTQVGVEMYLKFHPGANAIADNIGLTQVAEGVINGVQDTGGIRGQRSATSGAGVGRFVDRIEGFPNPVYPTTQAVVPGGSASNLGDYATAPVTPLNATQQAATATSTGVTGRRYRGWGRNGFHRMVGGALVAQAAELYDSPVMRGAGPNSEQVFETAALSIGGALNRTYYGSVEWGWRKNPAGAFNRLPLRVVSEGVPSVNFLTAAAIWNQSGASLTVTTTVATNLVDVSQNVISPIPINTVLISNGEATTPMGVRYYAVNYGGNAGYVVGTAVRLGTGGAATVDLPVPIIHTVTNPAGSTMILESAPVDTVPLPPGSTRHLPINTRIRTTRCMVPRGALTHHYEGEVANGPHTGTRGYFDSNDLTIEERGTR